MPIRDLRSTTADMFVPKIFQGFEFVSVRTR